MPKKKLFDDYSSDEDEEVSSRSNKNQPDQTALLQALTEKVAMMESSQKPPSDDFDKQAVVKQLKKIESCVDKLRYLKQIEAEERLRAQKAKMKKKKNKIKLEKETLAVKEKALQKEKEVVKESLKEKSSNIGQNGINSVRNEEPTKFYPNKKGLGHKKKTINLELAAEKILSF